MRVKFSCISCVNFNCVMVCLCVSIFGALERDLRADARAHDFGVERLGHVIICAKL